MGAAARQIAGPIRDGSFMAATSRA